MTRVGRCGGGGMVADVSLREATPPDAPAIVRLLRRMLDEMAFFGGHPVSTDEEGWSRLEETIASRAAEDHRLFVLAERAKLSTTTIGLAQASVTTREHVFEPARVLHLHALYVEPDQRRHGIGQALLRATLEWGRSKGCAEAELSVLVGNPARRLYKDLGFHPLQTEMVRRL